MIIVTHSYIIVIDNYFLCKCRLPSSFHLYTIQQLFSKDFHCSCPYYTYLQLYFSKDYLNFCLNPRLPNDSTVSNLIDVTVISNFTNLDYHCFSPPPFDFSKKHYKLYKIHNVLYMYCNSFKYKDFSSYG